MYVSPRLVRRQRFKALYQEAPIVAPRTLEQLQPLLDNGTLLHEGKVFATMRTAETTLAEYCEVQCKGLRCAQRNSNSALLATCSSADCTFRCKVSGRIATEDFICTEFVPHSCEVLTTHAAFEGRKRCNITVHMFAAIPAMRLAAEQGKSYKHFETILERYTKLPTDSERILRVKREILANPNLNAVPAMAPLAPPVTAAVVAAELGPSLAEQLADGSHDNDNDGDVQVVAHGAAHGATHGATQEEKGQDIQEVQQALVDLAASQEGDEAGQEEDGNDQTPAAEQADDAAATATEEANVNVDVDVDVDVGGEQHGTVAGVSAATSHAGQAALRRQEHEHERQRERATATTTASGQRKRTRANSSSSVASPQKRMLRALAPSTPGSVAFETDQSQQQTRQRRTQRQQE